MEELIIKQKPFYDVNDIMQLMDCKRNKAYEYIQIIKSVSDRGKTLGRVMVADFNLWAYGTTTGETSKEEVKKNEFVRAVPFRKRFY